MAQNKEEKAAKQKAWREKNKKHLQEYEKKRYRYDKKRKSRTPEEQKEYKAQRQKERYAAQKELYASRNRTAWDKESVKWRVYKRAAEKRGLEWSVSREEFSKCLHNPCSYCGRNPARGVDREDNALGYTSSNSVACCKKCNFAKNKYSVEEFLRWAREVAEYQKGKVECQSPPQEKSRCKHQMARILSLPKETRLPQSQLMLLSVTGLDALPATA